jgi:HSP20 family protein
MYDTPTRTRTRDPLLNLMERVFNTAGSSGDADYLTDSAAGERSWVPPVNIYEDDDAYVVTLDLPGLTKKDIDVGLEDNVLTVSGERGLDGERERYRRVERAFGTFRRSFTLPREIDATKVEAKFKDGVLTLTMPKAEVAKSRKIAIG